SRRCLLSDVRRHHRRRPHEMNDDVAGIFGADRCGTVSARSDIHHHEIWPVELRYHLTHIAEYSRIAGEVRREPVGEADDESQRQSAVRRRTGRWAWRIEQGFG